MQILFEIYSFLFGLLIGSFLNVVIYRLPLKKDLVFTRSNCPVCGHQLKWYHNIPLLSFIFLKGKCAFCSTRIPWRYPLVELMTGLISFWLFPHDINEVSVGFYFFYFAIACSFVCHFFIDLDHQLLMDKINIYLVALILPFSVISFEWPYWVSGGVFGFSVPFFVTWLFYKIKGQVGLGGGDIKLFGILGLLLGPTGIFFTIFFSCFVGALVGVALILSNKMSKDKPMPFGPLIILVASFQIFFQKQAAVLQSWFF